MGFVTARVLRGEPHVILQSGPSHVGALPLLNGTAKTQSSSDGWDVSFLQVCNSSASPARSAPVGGKRELLIAVSSL
jgi:hypothetical protein